MLLQEEKLKSVLNKEKTVVRVALELQVSRQTIHKWLSRYRRFGIDGLIIQRRKRHAPAANRTSPEREIIVGTLAGKYWRDGVETLGDRLQEEYGFSLHPTTIYRILKRRNLRYTNAYPRTKKRWKKRLYAHQLPGQELQMDTKYPFGYKQGKVIYAIIDDASRWVFVWSYASANRLNTLDFLRKVLVRAPFDIQKIRTDQGREFIALEVKEFLWRRGIVYRNNTPYCPEENGKIERFNGTLNQKALRFGFSPRDTLELMQYRLNLFLHYYNYRKKHRGLGMDGKTPMQRLQECASVNLTLQCHNN